MTHYSPTPLTPSKLPLSCRGPLPRVGRLPPDQDAAPSGFAFVDANEQDVLPRPAPAGTTLGTIPSRRASTTLSGRMTPDSDGFGYSEFEGNEPLVPPAEALAAALAEQQLRRRSSHNIAADQEPREHFYPAAGAAAAVLATAAIVEHGPASRRRTLEGGAQPSGLPSLQEQRSAAGDTVAGGEAQPPPRRLSRGMSNIMLAAAAVAAATESFVGYALGSGSSGGGAASMGGAGQEGTAPEPQPLATQQQRGGSGVSAPGALLAGAVGEDFRSGGSVAERALRKSASIPKVDSFTLPAMPFDGGGLAAGNRTPSSGSPRVQSSASCEQQQQQSSKLGEPSKLGLGLGLSSQGSGVASQLDGMPTTIAAYHAAAELGIPGIVGLQPPAAVEGAQWGSATSHLGGAAYKANPFATEQAPGVEGALGANGLKPRAPEMSPFGQEALSRLAAKSAGIGGTIALLNSGLAASQQQSEIEPATDNEADERPAVRSGGAALLQPTASVPPPSYEEAVTANRWVRWSHWPARCLTACGVMRPWGLRCAAFGACSHAQDSSTCLTGGVLCHYARAGLVAMTMARLPA